MTLVGRSFYC